MATAILANTTNLALHGTTIVCSSRAAAWAVRWASSWWHSCSTSSEIDSASQAACGKLARLAY
jgi:hypothetical protein